MLTKPEANLAYPNYPLTLEEGEQLLTDAIYICKLLQKKRRKNCLQFIVIDKLF